MSDQLDENPQFHQDTSYFEDDELRDLSKFALRIQLAATGISTSFILLFVPNVETITILAFLFGFLFPMTYALSITITMVIGWELLLTMVLSFSGVTFFFKFIAWCLITLLGTLARKLRINQAYEFGIFGFFSTLLFDIIVTISIPLVFVNNDESFVSVLITAFIFGIPFTIAHVISNSILFSFFPKLVLSILPVFESRYSHLIKIRRSFFDQKFKIRAIFLTIFIVLAMGFSIASFQHFNDGGDPNEVYSVNVHFSYSDLIPDEYYIVETNSSMSFLDVTRTVADVSVHYDFIAPYVYSINGIRENDDLANHFWIYYVDDSRGNFDVGAPLYREDVKENSTISWRYEN
ncbi:MAG: DUF4430 domain-containing protein [Candidatus Kariarchaeaceae archaeon]